jgi:hypothetical protein
MNSDMYKTYDAATRTWRHLFGLYLSQMILICNVESALSQIRESFNRLRDEKKKLLPEWQENGNSSLFISESGFHNRFPLLNMAIFFFPYRLISCKYDS